VPVQSDIIETQGTLRHTSSTDIILSQNCEDEHLV